LTMQTPPCRIAVVIPKYGLVGGAEGFAAELTERIARDDRYEIHVFANAWQALSDRVAFHRVPMVRFPRFLITPSFAYFANQAVEQGSFDLVHAHDRLFAADLYTLHGVPHRFWSREVRRKRWLSLFDRATIAVERRLVRGGRCRRFLAVSTLAREVFLQEYGLPAEQVPVIHPGIALEETSPDEREIQRRAVRQRYGIAPEETVILFVSMNFAVKGLDAVLAGTARLLRQRPEAPVRLLVVGRDRAAPYEALARRLGIERQVLFAGLVERKALGGFYAAADLYAMLSRFDTFGLVVLEAMAAGLPVLVSGNVGAKDVVDPGVNGFVVADPDDTTEVAQRLASLLDERSQAAMARAARQTARRYTWEATANSVKAVYDELLRERRP